MDGELQVNDKLEAILLERFAEIFCKEVWIGNGFAQVFYDPQLLARARLTLIGLQGGISIA